MVLFGGPSGQGSSSVLSDLLFVALLIRSVARDLFGVSIFPSHVVNELMLGLHLEAVALSAHH